MMNFDVQLLGDINTIGLGDDEPLPIYFDPGTPNLGNQPSRLNSLLHQLSKSVSFQCDRY